MGNKKVFSLLLAVMLVLSVLVLPTDALATDEVTVEKVVTIIHTNDVHGNAVEDEEAGKLGYAKLKTFVDSKGDVLLLDAGDVLHGTTFATISQGESMVKLMNEIGYDALVPGNHDYNYGSQRLLALQEEANFDILQANVVNTVRGDRILAPNAIYEVNGVNVGVFGIATPETKTKSSPLNTEGLTFTDYIRESVAQVADLKAKGADVVVALVHLGLDEASAERADLLARAVPEIDVMIDGHSHTVLETGKTENGVLIAQTGNHLQNVGEVTITLDNEKILGKVAKLHTYEDLKDLTPNAEILAEIEAIEEANQPYLETVVGTTTVELDGVRENVRSGETNLGNLLTDAMLDISGADVALTNGGGIRASIPAGEITMGQVLEAFPFTNYPVTLEISGENILKALEFGLDSAPEVVGKFPHVAGMTFKYDVNQPAGSRVFDLMIGEEPIDLAKTYTLVTNDFMAIGGDGYEVLAEGVKVAEYPLLSEVLADYIREAGTVSPEVEGRITEGTKPVDDEGFTDIVGHWAETYILSGVENGFFKGMTETTFEPETRITRGMIVTTLHRLEDEPTATDPSSFPDVIAEDWYGPAVAWASENEIVKGYDDGTFKPNQELTREEMAAIISRYLGYKDYPIVKIGVPEFADEAMIAEWASADVDVMQITSIMQGKPGNLFDPQGKATRAELAKVMFELNELLNVEVEDAA